MEIEVTARSDGIPDQARNYARDRIARVGRVFGRVGSIHVFLELAREESRAHAVAHLDSGATLRAETAHEQLQGAIDLLATKLEKQVRRTKERLIGRNRRGAPEPVDAGGPEPDEPSYDDVLRDKLDED